ncbi:MAG: hypothetical protein ACREID_03035 [Planctomycetota bacterium]
MNRIDEPRPPSRVLAFILVLLAIAALLIPFWYTVHVHGRFGPFGSLIAWTTATVGVIATLTVVLSVVRHFIAPALRQRAEERNL